MVKEAVGLQCTIPIKNSAWQKYDHGRSRLAIEMDADEKLAIRGRKWAEMSVFGTTLSPIADLNLPRSSLLSRGYFEWF